MIWVALFRYDLIGATAGWSKLSKTVILCYFLGLYGPKRGCMSWIRMFGWCYSFYLGSFSEPAKEWVLSFLSDFFLFFPCSLGFIAESYLVYLFWLLLRGFGPALNILGPFLGLVSKQLQWISYRSKKNELISRRFIIIFNLFSF